MSLARAAIDAAIILNETALSVESIIGVIVRLRNGHSYTEDEFDRLLMEAKSFNRQELEKVEKDIIQLEGRLRALKTS